MKKHQKHIIAVLWLLLGASALLLNAQTEKGRWRLGASLGYAPTLPAEDLFLAGNNAGLNLVDGILYSYAINQGYFVSNKAMIGLNVIAYGYVDEGVEVLGLLPSFRYYVHHSPKVDLFCEAKGGFYNMGEFNRFKYVKAIGMQVGSAFFLNKNIALDLFMDLNYLFAKKDFSTYNETITNFGVSFGLFF